MIELEPILTALTDNQVHFVIIGGVAITAHGSAYVTSDLDIAFLRTRENTDKDLQCTPAISTEATGIRRRPTLRIRFKHTFERHQFGVHHYARRYRYAR